MQPSTQTGCSTIAIAEQRRLSEMSRSIEAVLRRLAVARSEFERVEGPVAAEESVSGGDAKVWIELERQG